MTLSLRLILISAILMPLLNAAILPSLAQASEQQMAQKVNCNNPQTTLEMNICATQEYQAADKKLNQVYRQLQSRLSGKQKQRMTNAQLAWMKFRDANCQYERGQFACGTLAGSVGTNCLAGMTEKRTKELEEYLQDTNR